VLIRNARLTHPAPTLDQFGFTLVKHKSKNIDFCSDEDIVASYYPQAEQVFMRSTGADEVVIFDHTVRTDASEEGVQRPARHVHNDYTAASIVQRIIDVVGGDEAVEKLQHRFAEINLWRPIENMVQTSPLAIADARSILRDDLVKADIIYADRIGEIFEVVHRDSHLWYYYPNMMSDEALLFVGYDSLPKRTGRFTPHTAFDDPDSPEGAAPRKSIELRAIVFFTDD